MLSAFSRRAVHAVLVSVLLGACAPIISKTPVHGDRATLQRLVGEWEGSYDSPDTRRKGDILFRLRAGADTAEGDVVMTSRRGAAEVPSIMKPAVENLADVSQLLAIRFVVAADNDVRGFLLPYRDPDCGCSLTTAFRGRLSGDTIAGTFESTGTGIFHMPVGGTWNVTRRPSAK